MVNLSKFRQLFFRTQDPITSMKPLSTRLGVLLCFCSSDVQRKISSFFSLSRKDADGTREILESGESLNWLRSGHLFPWRCRRIPVLGAVQVSALWKAGRDSRCCFFLERT